MGIPHVNRDLVLEGTPSSALEESHLDKKKRLSQLFQDRLRVGHDEDEPKCCR